MLASPRRSISAFRAHRRSSSTNPHRSAPGSGPNPARLLAASVGSCLAASLLFCMRKAHVEVEGMRTRVQGTLVRNERGRLRIGGLRVRLEPVLALELHDRVPRCLELFEDFCVVTASVRKGIPVDVDVVPVTA
jgi:organic hydroperoxide reductase OsmC/OhrA